MTVGIVVVNKNYGRYIGRMLESVRAQTHSDWRMVVVDDGSEDESVVVIGRHQYSDPRIQMIQTNTPHHKMPHECTNIGLARLYRDSEVTHIVKFDADDIMQPYFLETLFGMFTPGVVIAFGSMRMTDADFLEIGPPLDLSEYLIGLPDRNLIPETAMFSVPAIFEAKEEYYRWEQLHVMSFLDKVCALLTIYGPGAFSYTAHPLHFYRAHVEQISHRNNRHRLKEFRAEVARRFNEEDYDDDERVVVGSGA